MNDQIDFTTLESPGLNVPVINNKFHAKAIFYAKPLHFIRVYSNALMPFYKKERFFLFFLIHFHIFRKEDHSDLDEPLNPLRQRFIRLQGVSFSKT